MTSETDTTTNKEEAAATTVPTLPAVEEVRPQKEQLSTMSNYIFTETHRRRINMDQKSISAAGESNNETPKDIETSSPLASKRKRQLQVDGDTCPPAPADQQPPDSQPLTTTKKRARKQSY